MGDDETITKRPFIDQSFPPEDRDKFYSDSEFHSLLLNRVRCLECEHFFEWRPGVFGTEEGTCWNCQTVWCLHKDNGKLMELHSVVVVFVCDPNSKEDGGIYLVGSVDPNEEGNGWALVEYLQSIGDPIPDLFDLCGP